MASRLREPFLASRRRNVTPSAAGRQFEPSARPAEADISGPQGKSEDQPQAKQIAPAEGVTPPAEVHACPAVHSAPCTTPLLEPSDTEQTGVKLPLLELAKQLFAFGKMGRQGRAQLFNFALNGVLHVPNICSESVDERDDALGHAGMIIDSADVGHGYSFHQSLSRLGAGLLAAVGTSRTLSTAQLTRGVFEKLSKEIKGVQHPISYLERQHGRKKRALAEAWSWVSAIRSEPSSMLDSADSLPRSAGVVSGSEVYQRVTARIPVGRYAGR
jgi:hypothetical protein